MEERNEEAKKKLKVSDFRTHDTNPSMINIIGLRKIAKREKKTEPSLVVNKETGNTRDMDVEIDEYQYNGWDWKDSGHFTKLFKGCEVEIRKLTTTSTDVLMYIIEILKRGKDEVIIDADACAKKLGYNSKSSVYRGIFGLLDAGFIYRKSGLEGSYFVDVNKIFKGHRARLKEKPEDE